MKKPLTMPYALMAALTAHARHRHRSRLLLTAALGLCARSRNGHIIIGRGNCSVERLSMPRQLHDFEFAAAFRGQRRAGRPGWRLLRYDM